jgi:dolichol-phosphate mannosyltransferase
VPQLEPLVSVVCPAYEEESVLPFFHDRLAAVVSRLEGEYRFEIVYVDDGSSDGTLVQIRQLAVRDQRVRYLSLSRNFGKEAALAAGLERTLGDVVITLDSDLQHPPELIPELLERWRAGYDIVRTERLQHHQGSPFRRLSARAFHKVMQWLNDNRELATSDYTLLSRRVVDALGRMPEAHRYIRGLVTWLGFPTTTQSFEVATRAGGTSKFNVPRLLALASDGMLSFSRWPLRLCLLGGAFLALLGVVEGAVALLWLLLSRASSHFELHVLVTLDLVLAGILLCGLGVVGEYVGRIYEQVKQRPLYLVKEQSPATAGVQPARYSPGESSAA